MTTRKRVPQRTIGDTVIKNNGENQGFLNMFIGFARKPIEEWPDPLEMCKNISKKREDNKEYFRNKKDGSINNKKI